jgi:hypothetical protein
MTLFWKKFSFVTILFSILMATGCVSSDHTLSGSGGIINVSPPSVPPTTTNPSMATRLSVQCSGKNNESFSSGAGEPFILINPVSHSYIGENITFGGTTNLPHGETILLQIYSGDSVPCPKSTAGCEGQVRPCCGGFSDTVPVITGPCGISSWSWGVNTSQHGFQADNGYILTSSGRNGIVMNNSFFIVSGIPQPNLTLNLPENDPNSNALQLSGQVNTGNGPDERLLLTVSSDSGKNVRFTIPVAHDGNGYSWNFSLKKTEILPYNFYTVNITSMNNPQIGIIRTFLYNNEPQYYPYNPYSP